MPEQLEHHPEACKKPEWTVSTLLAHIQALLDEKDRRYNERFVANEAARKEAKTEMDRRLEGMNEFRDQLNKQAGTFLTIDIYNARHDAIVSKVDLLGSRMDRQEARKEGLSATWGWVFGAVGMVSAIIIAAYEIFKK